MTRVRKFGLQLILSGICYLPAADVTCARISNARHTYLLRKTLRPFANGLGGPRESSNEIHRQAVQAFHPGAEFVHMSSFCPLDLGHPDQNPMTSVTNTHNPAGTHALVNPWQSFTAPYKTRYA